MLTTAHAMQRDVETVSPKMGLVDLERKFLTSGRNAFPVIEDGKLIGIVSRADIVRLLSIERSTEEQRSDFYRSIENPTRARSDEAEVAAINAAVGERAAGRHVRDAMTHQVVSVDVDQPLTEVARLLLDGHIHRLPVVEEGRLKGIVTTLDIVRLFAQGQLIQAPPDDAAAEHLLGPGTSPGDRLAKTGAALEARLDKLLARTAAIEKDLRSAVHPDSEERATERQNDEVLERLGDSERTQVVQVRRALARIEAGSYEACEQCGNPVGQARQAALPEATRCRACA